MAKKPIRDTFFLDPERALKKARKQKTLTIMEEPLPNSIFFTDIATQKRQEFYHDLQICYYPGEKLEGDNIPRNCINVPFDKIFDFFKETRLRYPEIVDFKGINLKKNEKEDFVKLFNQALSNANGYKNQKLSEYIEEIKINKPDFNEPLRFFLMANRHTTVMQYASKNIVKTLKELNFEVEFSIEQNSMELLDMGSHLKALAKFNPHITININHLNNEYLNEHIFNFIWFQDPMPGLYDSLLASKLRKKDYLFSVAEILDNLLIKGGINKENILRQYVCTDPSLFKLNKNIQREEKIVFIGRTYDGIIDESNEIHNLIVKKIKEMIRDNSINIEKLKYLAADYKVNYSYLREHFLAAVFRTELVSWICTQTKLKVEIYGNGWEKIPTTKNFYKGELKYGKDLVNTYNSAKYALVFDINLAYPQRLLEMTACGAIPILYDNDLFDNKEFKHRENVLLFKTPQELFSCLKKEPKQSPIQISKDITYKNMIKKILGIITSNNNLSKGKI